MENQHRKITGYRELTQTEIDNMNTGKELEVAVMEFIDSITWNTRKRTGEYADARWLAIAKTDLQKGFMSLGRAIARPDGY